MCKDRGVNEMLLKVVKRILTIVVPLKFRVLSGQSSQGSCEVGKSRNERSVKVSEADKPPYVPDYLRYLLYANCFYLLRVDVDAFARANNEAKIFDRILFKF